MTQEWMLKTLVTLGFRWCDAEVYVFLALKGAHNASAIAEAIRTYEQQVYHTLKRLQNQKIVSETSDLPTHFTALPFDKLLDLLVKANLQEAKQIEQNKDNILALWNSCIKKEQAK